MNLQFCFGRDASHVEPCDAGVELSLPNRVLVGDGIEQWSLSPMSYIGDTDGLHLWRGDVGLCGAAALDVNEHTLGEAAHRLYCTLLDATAGSNIYRVWNFVPGINCAIGELDRYMAFCVGRATAFEESLDAGQRLEMPAASAVGTTGDRLLVVFIAGTQAVSMVENPAQIPAYRYPSRYGPKPPSFARAGRVGIAPTQALYISGTASIRRSESMHAGDLEAQTMLAMENLRIVAEAAEMRNTWQGGRRRTVRAYVRHARHAQRVKELVERYLLHPADTFNVIQADVCRPELLVELEAYVPTNS